MSSNMGSVLGPKVYLLPRLHLPDWLDITSDWLGNACAIFTTTVCDDFGYPAARR